MSSLKSSFRRFINNAPHNSFLHWVSAYLLSSISLYLFVALPDNYFKFSWDDVLISFIAPLCTIPIILFCYALPVALYQKPKSKSVRILAQIYCALSVLAFFVIAFLPA